MRTTNRKVCQHSAAPSSLILSVTCHSRETRMRRDSFPKRWESRSRMNDKLIILDGCTFMYSDGCGDVEAQDAEGLFYQDVRHLSRWLLRVDEMPLEPLTSRRVDYYSARVVGARQDGDAPPVSVRRDRFVTEGMHEDVVLENLRD